MRAELLKLTRRSIVWIVMATFLALASVISFYLSNAEAQYRVAVGAFNQVAHPKSEAALCDFLGVRVGSACDEARAEELGFARRFLTETRRLYPLATAAQSPIGLGGVVAGLMASLLGAIIVGGLACAHVAGEWSNGTISVVLARRPSRIRFFLSKFMSAWLVGCFMILLSWAALILVSPLLRLVYTVPPSPSGFEMWSYTAGQLLRSFVVIGVFAALGTAAGVIVRAPLGAFGLVLALIFFSLVLSAWRSTFKGSLGYWIGVWMRFKPATLWADHLWVDRFPLVNPDPFLHTSALVAVLGLAATAGVALGAGALRMQASDVG